MLGKFLVQARGNGAYNACDQGPSTAVAQAGAGGACLLCSACSKMADTPCIDIITCSDWLVLHLTISGAASAFTTVLLGVCSAFSTPFIGQCEEKYNREQGLSVTCAFLWSFAPLAIETNVWKEPSCFWCRGVYTAVSFCSRTEMRPGRRLINRAN